MQSRPCHQSFAGGGVDRIADALPAGATLSFMSSNSPPGAAVSATRDAAPPRRFARLPAGPRAPCSGCLVRAWATLFVWLALCTGRFCRTSSSGVRRSSAAPAPRSAFRAHRRDRGRVRAAGCRRSSCAMSAVLTPMRREALTLPRVAAALSPRSLLALQPRFEQLLIDGAELDVRRDAPAGCASPASSSTPRREAATTMPLADWFFRQHEFVDPCRRVRWIDERRGSRRRCSLGDVDLVMRNGLREHDVRGSTRRRRRAGASASPCAAASPSRCSPAAATGAAGAAPAYAELPRADLRELRRHAHAAVRAERGRRRAARLARLVRAASRAPSTADVALRACRAAPRRDRRAAGVRAASKAGSTPSGPRRSRPASRRASFGFQHRRRRRLAGRATCDCRLARWRSGAAAAASSAPSGSTSRSSPTSATRCRSVPRCASCSPTSHRAASSASCDTRWDGAARRAGAATASRRLHQPALSLARPAVAERPRGLGRPGLAQRRAASCDANESGGEAQTRDARRRRIDLPGVFERARARRCDRLDAQLSWRVERAAAARRR